MMDVAMVEDWIKQAFCAVENSRAPDAKYLGPLRTCWPTFVSHAGTTKSSKTLIAGPNALANGLADLVLFDWLPRLTKRDPIPRVQVGEDARLAASWITLPPDIGKIVTRRALGESWRKIAKAHHISHEWARRVHEAAIIYIARTCEPDPAGVSRASHLSVDAHSLSAHPVQR